MVRGLGGVRRAMEGGERESGEGWKEGGLGGGRMVNKCDRRHRISKSTKI